jgi:3-dehydroquinate synthase
MKKVKLELASGDYEVRIGAGLLSRIGLWLKEKGFSGKVVVITDTIVKEFYYDMLYQGLVSAGFDVILLDIPAGEEQKTLGVAGQLYKRLADAYAERTTPVLALGGGVIGDLVGFVAATYMRGVPLIHIPTTLLAQVDSSIGGKTAVDHGRLKNVVGVFYQPQMVVADIETLRTLPQEELVSGMAEIIKHAAIRSRQLFQFLENNMEKARLMDQTVLEMIIYANSRIKAEVVGKDEKETGLRAVLNYGHTIGHAVEAVSGFKLKHGHAVAIGMVAAARIASRMNFLSIDNVNRLEDLLKEAGLPVTMPELDVHEVIEAMKHDKKVYQDTFRFVLLKSIGHSFITDRVSPELVEEVLSV